MDEANKKRSEAAEQGRVGRASAKNKDEFSDATTCGTTKQKPEHKSSTTKAKASKKRPTASDPRLRREIKMPRKTRIGKTVLPQLVVRPVTSMPEAPPRPRHPRPTGVRWNAWTGW